MGGEIDRRTFLERGVKLGIASLLLPEVLMVACARTESPKPESYLNLGGDNEKGFGQFTIVFPKDYFSKRRYSFMFAKDGRQIETTINLDSENTVIEETLKKITKGSSVLQDQLEFVISNLNPRKQYILTSAWDEWEGFRENWKFKSVKLGDETVWLPAKP